MAFEAGGGVASAAGGPGPVVLEAIGRALAALHAFSPPAALPGVTAPAAVLEQVLTRVAAMCERVPEAEGVLRRAFARLERDPPVGPRAPAFLHGDFGPAQLLWRGDRVVIFDFDRATLGDPALDLGTVLTQFRRSTLRKPGRLGDFATLRATLIDAYARCAGPDPALADRVGCYERATMLRRINLLLIGTAGHRQPP